MSWRFITCATCVVLGQSPLAACAQDVQWRVNSLLHPHLFGESARIFASEVENLTEGAFAVDVEDQIVLDVDSFDALRSGLVDAVWGSPSHHHREDPSLALFSGFPFGPGPARFANWMTDGGGTKTLNTVYARHGLRSIYCGALPAESGGWFKSPIERVEDLNGLAMRSFGYGARTLRNLGVTTYELPASDIHSAFETGVIDAAEFAMPSLDAMVGLDEAANYLYLLGWQQPTTSLELLVTERAWLELPRNFQSAVLQGCAATLRWSLGAAEERQQAALDGFHAQGIEILEWPEAVLVALERSWTQVIEIDIATNPGMAFVWQSYLDFERRTPQTDDN